MHGTTAAVLHVLLVTFIYTNCCVVSVYMRVRVLCGRAILTTASSLDDSNPHFL